MSIWIECGTEQLIRTLLCNIRQLEPEITKITVYASGRDQALFQKEISYVARNAVS
jgi:hypothetical protein